jgi:hypothetical protein
MLEGQDYTAAEGHQKSGGKNFVNSMSQKFNDLMAKKFKEAVKSIVTNPGSIKEHPLSV